MLDAQNRLQLVRITPPVSVTARRDEGSQTLRVIAIWPGGVVVAENPGGPCRLDLDSLGPSGEWLACPGGYEADLGFLLVAADTEQADPVLTKLATQLRKTQHLRICAESDVDCKGVSTGFERWRLPHLALPELDLADVDSSTEVLGRQLAAPILISCMTGGSELAARVNQRLAKTAQRYGFALGLGSQRAMLEEPDLLSTYAVRSLCPDVLLFANLGAVQLNHGVGPAQCQALVEAVGADALVLHLNALQEAVQPEGQTEFKGLRGKIEQVARALPCPVLIKEVGMGLGRDVACWAASSELAGLDVAGAGGTSWARVEGLRAGSELRRQVGEAFAGWGIPTAEALRECRAAWPQGVIVASGGISSGVDVAKALAMGASLVGLARAFVRAALEGQEAVDQHAAILSETLRIAMFCCGCATVDALQGVELAPL